MLERNLLSVADALARVLEHARTLPTETVALTEAFGRTLAADVAALRTQPPKAVSAMDGYAVRAADVAVLPADLDMIGQSAAGHGFSGAIGAGQTVRIFTGAPMPDGANAVLIQEDATAEGARIRAQATIAAGRHVRAAGLDFKAGERLLSAGTRLGPAEIALAAAMNHPTLPVVRQPRVAILATGDELVRPGTSPGPDQIVASNSFAVAGMTAAAGGVAIDLGIAGDTFEDLQDAISRARAAQADVLVTLGGASVGDHDLVKPALAKEGMELGFWRIAMRPGKPLLHGRLGDMAILGLPGNPVSSIVCSVLFLMPLLRALSGDAAAAADRSEPAVLGTALKANDERQDYLRASLVQGQDGLPVATAFTAQDSSLLRVLASASCLIIRAPHASSAAAGAPCRILRLTGTGVF